MKLLAPPARKEKQPLSLVGQDDYVGPLLRDRGPVQSCCSTKPTFAGHWLGWTGLVVVALLSGLVLAAANWRALQHWSAGLTPWYLVPMVLTGLAVAVLLYLVRAVLVQRRASSAAQQSLATERLEQQQQLQLAMQAGHLVPWEIDLLSGEVVQTATMATAFGLPENNSLRTRENWRELIHPADRLRLWQAVEQAKTGAELHVEYRFHHPDGSLHWHESHGRAVLDAQGQPARLVGYLQDITARKLAEQQAAQQRELLQKIFENIPVMLVIWDPNLRKFTLNRHTEEVLGWTTAEANQGDFMAKIYPDPAYRAEVSAFMQQLHPGWREWNITTKSGGVVPSEWANIRLTDQTMIGIGMDLRARQQAQAELRASEQRYRALFEQIQGLNTSLEQRVLQRTEQLAAANAELEAFCYSVSHDLRAPLRSMDGFSRILLQDHAQALDLTGRQYLERVRSGCQRMGRLIDDLLRLSRLNRTEMQCQPLDLSELAQRLGAELRANHPERPVRLEIAPHLKAMGDPELLQVALWNLLENAWKFTSQQPQPVIAIGTVELAGADSATATAFYVRDNGVGFDMAYSGKLFGAFQRLHSAEQFPGSGIGLAIVQRVITRHGGRIWAESQPGAGATFYFILPPE